MGSNLAIKPGSEVDYGERRFVIMQVISFEVVVARDVETGELERLPISGLQPILSAAPSALPPDLSVLDDRDWAEARRRLDLIGPVLEKARLPRSVMAERARAGGVEVTTLYRWARAFRATGLLSSLPVEAMGRAAPMPVRGRRSRKMLRRTRIAQVAEELSNRSRASKRRDRHRDGR
jgi:putative transposase